MSSKGHLNPNAKISTAEAKHICQLLQDKPHLSTGQIANLCRTTRHIVANINKLATWTHISSLYDFSRRRKNLQTTSK